MVDEIYDRGYQAARAQLNDALDGGATRLMRSVLDAFAVLNRIEYGAPWRTRPESRAATEFSKVGGRASTPRPPRL